MLGSFLIPSLTFSLLSSPYKGVIRQSCGHGPPLKGRLECHDFSQSPLKCFFVFFHGISAFALENGDINILRSIMMNHDHLIVPLIWP